MTVYVTLQWVDKDTKEIIFEDSVEREEFKRIHGVSPHIDALGKPCGVVVHHSDVRRDS